MIQSNMETQTVSKLVAIYSSGKGNEEVVFSHIISRWQFSFDWNSNRFLCFGSNIIWCEKTFHDVNDQFWYLLMKIVFCSCCREFPPLQITYETSPSTREFCPADKPLLSINEFVGTALNQWQIVGTTA